MTKVIPVIITDNSRRGDGRSADSPVRMITQIFTPEGELLMENDPCASIVTQEEARIIRELIYKKLGENPKSKSLWEELCKEIRK
jgi:hypothetical protein